VNGATISAYQLNTALARGSLLAQAATAADGSFSLTLPVYSGMIEVVATGGTYPEEARRDAKGDPIPLALTAELTTVIPSFSAGGTAAVTITPFSTVARWLAKKGATTTDAGTAIASAWTCVNNHFGGGVIDWRTVVPVNFALPHGETLNVSTSDPAVKAGLLLAALSQVATTMAADTSVTGATLAAALAEDAKDGVLDGKLNGGPITSGTTGTPNLDSYLTRRVLGQAVLDFVSKGANPAPAQLTTTSVYPFASQLAGDSAVCLFPSGDAPLPLTVMPPALAFTDAAGNPAVPPQYTNSADGKVTLYVTATDPLAQVTGVHAQSGAMVVDGTLNNGVWTLAGIPLNPNSLNTVYVWGVDALGAGSITGSGTRIVSIIHDSRPPTFFPDFVTTTTYDERGLVLVAPTLPAAYSLPPDAMKQPVSSTSPVYKAATRLAPAQPLSAQILETTNPDNIPYLRVSVPVASGQAPISAVGYSISDGVNTYGGSLLAPPPSTDPSWLSTVTADAAWFDLPLSSLTVPSLATTTAGTISLDVSFIATDAAGNCSGYVSVGKFPFNVVAPPLYVAEDTSYAGASDTKSTYYYSLTSGVYPILFDSTSTLFLPTNSVRLVRFFVSNPTLVPIAISPPGAASWSGGENWSADNTVVSGPGNYTYCTATGAMGNIPGWGGPIGACSPCYGQCNDLWGDGSQIVCGQSSVSSPAFLEKAGGGCAASYGTVQPATLAWSSSTGSEAYLFANNMDYGPAAKTLSGNYIVPAASGGNPGVLAVYVTRPRNASTMARTIPLSGTGPAYTITYGRDFVWTGGAAYNCGSSTEQCVTVGAAYRRARSLATATDSLTGTFTPTSWALTSGSTEKGASTTSSVTLPLTRTINH
jgi:hypothetical protein